MPRELPRSRNGATGYDAFLVGLRWSREIERSQRERDREIRERYMVEARHRGHKRLAEPPTEERHCDAHPTGRGDDSGKEVDLARNPRPEPRAA